MDGKGTTESAWTGRLAVSVRARKSTRDDEQACNAAGQAKRRRDHCSRSDVQNAGDGDGKRVRSCDNSGAFGPIGRCNDRQSHCSDEEIESLLFSSSPKAAGSGNVQDPSGSEANVQQFSSFEIDPIRHKIFLSHSGAQKNFVEQLYVDLEARGYLFPFFDQSHHSLPKGKDFVALIKQAARLCHVAVIVLSEEFLCSKWPMIELAEFYAAKQGGNDGMNILPLFYKLSVGDLDDRSIEDRWMPKWYELASKDKRIDVTQWAAAVRALRGVNGLPFCKNTRSKLGYRKEIVQSIWKLSPGELLYDSAREMVGYHRICQRVSKQFVEDTRVGASVLGLYGTSGLGKTTLSKALCDYFAEEFMGRVCHLELGAMTRMKRQELMLKTLCGFEEDVLNRLIDDRQGLKRLRDWMKWEPVFLVIDNVTNDERSRKEVVEYLTAGFHPKSKIMITARSKEVLQDLLPGVRFCMSIPRLNEEEARMIFLRSAAPMKSLSSLTDEERRIVGLCIQQCNFKAEAAEFLDVGVNPDNCIFQSPTGLGTYHPLALSALGDFFYRLSSNTEILHWKDSLEVNNELMRDVLQSRSITSIIGLQFSTFSSSEQLLFLDIALYSNPEVKGGSYFVAFARDFDFWVEWLSALHGESATVIKRHLRDLKRSGMIVWYDENASYFRFELLLLYKEFAVWYVTQHGMNGLKNAWGVFQPCGSSVGSHHPRSKCISDLIRLRVFDSTRSNPWVLVKKRMQELQSVVVLQVHFCAGLRELSLAGLDSLRHLELYWLPNLVEVTVTRSSGSEEDGGISESLQYVVLWGLESLTHAPDFRSCTSLRHLRISNCPNVTNFEGVECPHLRELLLEGLIHPQLERPPNFGSLHCLKKLEMGLYGYVNIVDVMDPGVNFYSLMQGRYAERAVQQGAEDSDEFNAYSDADQNEDFFEKKTIINMRLENQFGKEGLSILQKVLLQYVHEKKTLGRDSRILRIELDWSFHEDDKEVLCLWGSNNRRYVIEWRFNDPEEYDK